MTMIKKFASLVIMAALLFSMGCQNSAAMPNEELRSAKPTISGGFGSSPGEEETSISTAEYQAPGSARQVEAGKSEQLNPSGITVHVDLNRKGNPISPFIYGIADADEEYLKELRPAFLSWGGNPSTRFNWKLGNAWNAGRDWVYKNVNYGVVDGVSESDRFLKKAQDAGIKTRLAVPTLGWVAKDRQSCSFPKPDGTCGVAQGANCEKPGEIADPNIANVASDPGSIAKWMSHLKDSGLIPGIIAMDNEPELWGYNHYDVHPECTTYEEVLDKYLAYSKAVREIAPGVELAGPVACCWYSYWNIAPGPAHKAPGGPTDYIAWFLDSLRQYDETNGQRYLDVLDVHYYPQSGVYNDKTDPEINALRLRSTKALWDRDYDDESWIGQPIYFIPRMQELIDQYYPGTRLGISEWNFGADNDIHGALAIGDVLGIFGREGVYYAAYWRSPPPGSPGFYAFKMFTNYDGNGNRFGGTSVWASSNDSDQVSSYAAYDSQSGRLQIMLINKNVNQTAPININISGFTAQPDAALFRYSGDNPGGIVMSDFSINSDTLMIDPPPSSISLLVLSAK